MKETILVFTNKERLDANDFEDFDVTRGNQLVPMDTPDDQKIILVFDGITKSNLDDLVKQEVLVNSVDRATSVYVLSHTNPEKSVIESLIEKLKVIGVQGEIHCKSDGSHSSLSDYKLLNLDDKERRFKALKLAIAGNPELESLIRLHKTFSIALLQDSKLDLESLKQDDQYKLAFKEIKNDLSTVEDILEITRKRIPEISKKS